MVGMCQDDSVHGIDLALEIIIPGGTERRQVNEGLRFELGLQGKIDGQDMLWNSSLLDKKNQSQAPAPVKAVEESCVTCGGAHSYRNYPATDGNVYHDNIKMRVHSLVIPLLTRKVDLKGIITRSGVAYQGPTIPTTSSSPPKVVERETEVTKDIVPLTNNGSTKDVQPLVVQVQPQVPNSKPVVAPGLKDQGSSVEIFGASSIKPISIMQKKERCGKKFTNPSILSLKTKQQIVHNIRRERNQPRLVIDLQSLNRPPNDSSIPNQHNSQNVTAITKQTTSLLPILPQPQQGSSDSILIQRIGELEQHMADMVRKAVDEIVTDAVDWAIQAPLRDRFRDFPEADMKEILHHCMWESYPTIRIMKTTPFHKQLYEASRDKSMGARDLTDKLHNRFAEHENKEIKRHAFTENTTGLVHLSDTSPPPLAVSSSNSRQLLELVDVRCRIGGKPLTEDRPATPEPAWSIPLSDLPVLVNNWASALTSTYAPPPENSLLAQTGDMTIFMRWMVPIDMDLIEGMQVWDIAAMYGISHWWFQRQRFYIDRHTSEGDRRAVRTHMRILSVVRIEVFSLYGYDCMKTIVLRRADLQEYIIAERDFKYLYPSDFEDFVTQLNLTKPRWDATGFEFKHDFTVIDSSRAVTFRDRYGVQMIMRFNEIHKFSDDTLQQIDEALDYQVKEFKVNRMNPSLNTRFWTRKDVDKSKEFMFAIQKRLKTRRIF
ncbi:hypothetical protein Tco_0781257 [Tanacetum coccineum]